MSQSEARSPDGVATEAQIRQAEAFERIAAQLERQNDLLEDIHTTIARGDRR